MGLSGFKFVGFWFWGFCFYSGGDSKGLWEI